MEVFFEKRQEQLVITETRAIDKIRLFSDQQKQLLRDHPEMEEIFLDFWGHGMVDEAIHEKTQAMYETWRRDIHFAVQEGIQTGEFNQDQTILAPLLLVALLEGIALQYLPNKETTKLDQSFDAVHDMMILWLRNRISEQDLPGVGTNGTNPQKAYPSDLTDRQWELVEPLIEQARDGGRPRTTSMKEVMNALLYTLSTGCSWRMLPHDFPGWQTVYSYYRQWKLDGTLGKMSASLNIDFDQIGALSEKE